MYALRRHYKFFTYLPDLVVSASRDYMESRQNHWMIVGGRYARKRDQVDIEAGSLGS